MDKRFSNQNLLEFGTLDHADFEFLKRFRGDSNKFGSAYQLIFVRLLNSFPRQKPFEVIEEITAYVSVQLSLDIKTIDAYKPNRKKIREHQKIILDYLGCFAPDETALVKLREHVLELSYQYEQPSILRLKANHYLRENRTLYPNESEFSQILNSQRHKARRKMFDRIHEKISSETIASLDKILIPKPKYSTIEKLKRSPKNASTASVQNLVSRLQIIEGCGILDIDISFINNNYLRALSGEVKRCSSAKIRTRSDIQILSSFSISSKLLQ